MTQVSQEQVGVLRDHSQSERASSELQEPLGLHPLHGTANEKGLGRDRPHSQRELRIVGFVGDETSDIAHPWLAIQQRLPNGKDRGRAHAIGR